MTSGAKSASDEKIYWQTAAEAARGLQDGRYDKGILCCGTGMGMSIVANKFKGVYASCCESVYAGKKVPHHKRRAHFMHGCLPCRRRHGGGNGKNVLGTSFTQDTDDALCGF